MKIYYIIIGFSLFFGIAAIYSFEKFHKIYMILKPVPVSLCMFSLIHATFSTSILPEQILFITGMFFGLIGDIILLRDKLLIWGMISFFTGHIIYILYFLSITSSFSCLLIAVISMISAIYFFIFAGIMPDDKKQKFIVPIFFYLSGISSMLYFALNYDLTHGSAFFYSAGALMFYISDAIIAYEKFIKKIHYGSIPILSTYYLAQALLTLGVLKTIFS